MINDLGELQKLLKLCRKQGVKELKLGDLSLVFGDEPRKQSIADDSEIETDEITEEQMMFLSAGG